MSNYYDDKLRELREKVLRKKQLEAEVAELERQYNEFKARAEELDKIRVKENDDVERLEGGSFAALIYYLIGKKDEKLDKERAEAYTAAVKYDAAAKELAEIDKELAARRNELGTVFDSELRYREAVAEKNFAIKKAGGEAAEEIMRREENILYLEKQAQELRESAAATVRALGTAGSVLGLLASAEKLGWYDVFGGGGIIADEFKHSYLDDAQFMTEKLQSDMRKVKTELADVKINADMKVKIEGFERFADYFFDGICSNWNVLDRIGTSKSQIENVIKRLEQVQSRVGEMLKEAEKLLAQERSALNDLINETKI